MEMTPSRMIVVLRGELGNQHKLANKRFAEAQEEEMKNPYNERKIRDTESARKSIERIESAAQALGRLNLGDIEDVYELAK